MLFTEPLFLFLFLPLLLCIYYVSPPRFRNPILIAASFVFYVAGEKLFSWVLLLSVLLNYFTARSIDRFDHARTRRRALGVGVASNLLLLVIFKYTDFLVVNLNVPLALLRLPTLPPPPMHLPIGISFFTFMGISYLVDVYRRQQKAQRSLSNFALYIMLFPHLIAGPIVRYGDIAKEIVSRRITRTEFAEGVRRFTVGMGKKMLIANTLAAPADKIFALAAHQLTSGTAWLGAVCYALQIYYDFSGYTDMAIGLARMFGFHFPENFLYPYVSVSITEFWRRWHISLSTWFRDYLFFPLGVRRPARRIYLNLLAVFFLCGLWHGASWNFVVWGLFHGAFLIFERMGLLRLLERAPAPLRHAYAMSVVLIGWVLFRAETLPQAVGYLGTMAGLSVGAEPMFKSSFLLNGEVPAALAFGLIGCAPTIPALRRQTERVAARLTGAAGLVFEGGWRTIHAAAVALVLVASITQSAAGSYNPFIYFRF
ncbi:MAG: alginate O-acetyltransferase complex protein AlgI [Acidobacteriota bacterium]|jgi:alginate O-acetyltransferase complex protein AlgI|nr:alginate O-acetyltransferase complex protein AlgI [Acidobacteriota bacterium]